MERQQKEAQRQQQEEQKKADELAERRREDYARIKQGITEDTQAQETDRAAMSMSKSAAEAFRREQEALADAQRRNIPLTTQQQAELHQLA